MHHPIIVIVLFVIIWGVLKYLKRMENLSKEQRRKIQLEVDAEAEKLRKSNDVKEAKIQKSKSESNRGKQETDS